MRMHKVIKLFHSTNESVNRKRKTAVLAAGVLAALLFSSITGGIPAAEAQGSTVAGSSISLGDNSVVTNENGGQKGYLADKKTDSQKESTWTSDVTPKS